MLAQLSKITVKCWNRVLHLCGQRFWTIFLDHDLPKKLKKNVVYVVLDNTQPWHTSFICPCGCKEILHMNLLPDESPCWQLTNHKDGTITLTPSILRSVGCKSHFWFRKGRIQWCRELS